MAQRTTKFFNALLHGVCLTDFDCQDQEGLQDVLLDYFTNPNCDTRHSGSSTSNENYDTDMFTENKLRFF